MINRGLLCMVIVQGLAIQMAQNSHNLSVTFDRDSPICCLGGRSLVTIQVGVRVSLFSIYIKKKIYYPQFLVQPSFSQCACSNTLASKTISIGMAEDVCKGLTAPYTHFKRILLFLDHAYSLIQKCLLSCLILVQEYVAHTWLFPCRHLLRVAFLISTNSVTTQLHVFPFSKSSCQFFILSIPVVLLPFLFYFKIHSLSFC